jgi:hypothetical protein
VVRAREEKQETHRGNPHGCFDGSAFVTATSAYFYIDSAETNCTRLSGTI